ncbi:WD40 repeat domain-containing protein [Gymnodinialimonas ulvae]|uniref:WD40 repeat domain-containing protein n=1 Tax=Gymnodinialimonas ulvae TaxID=3126504 RepID=UPI0030ED4EF9
MRKAGLAMLGLIILGEAAVADPAPERTDLLQSAWHVEQSRDALLSGDRATAILAALRAIPDTPTEADVETYSDAFDALHLAAASRAFQSDIPLDSSVFWSPNGRYLVSAPLIPDISGISEQTTVLWNTATQQPIADLLPGLGTNDYTNVNQFSAFGNPFSPDGDRIAISLSPEADSSEDMAGEIQIFDTATGQRLTSVAGDMFMGWSQSGQTMLISNRIGNLHWLYDTSTWQVVAEYPYETFEGGSQWGFFPGSDDAFYAVHEIYQYDPNGASLGPNPIHLYRLARDAGGQIADISDLRGIMTGLYFNAFSVNRFAPYVATTVYPSELVIMGLDGQVRSRIADVSALSFVEFVRDGTAVMIADPAFLETWSLDHVRVFDLDGASLDAELREVAPITDNLRTPDGAVITFPNGLRRALRDPRPVGLELYEEVWPEILPELQAQIDDERVRRP